MTIPHDAAPGERGSFDLTEEAVAVLQASADVLRPLLRGWLHAVTAPAAVVCALVLVVGAPSGRSSIAAAVFGVTSVLLFTTSAMYHRGHWSAYMHALLKRLDHANIFLMIAGTYTPFTALALTGSTRAGVLAGVWATAAAGVVFRVLWVDAPRWLYVLLYISLGWAAVVFTPEWLHGAGVTACVLAAAGGLLYTAGGVVYGLRRPNPSPRWFGFHETFHACTVAAFTCQYVAASLLVYRAA